MRGQLTTEQQQTAEHEDREQQRAAALAQWGVQYQPEDPAALDELPRFCLWLEHAVPFRLWSLAQSCMRYGPAHPAGIDHAALADLVRRTRCMRLPSSPRRRAAIWRDLAAIEGAALREWAKMREERRAEH